MYSSHSVSILYPRFFIPVACSRHSIPFYILIPTWTLDCDRRFTDARFAFHPAAAHIGRDSIFVDVLLGEELSVQGEAMRGRAARDTLHGERCAVEAHGTLSAREQADRQRLV